MSDYTPTEVWTDTIVLPDDGTERQAAHVNVPFQAGSNREQWLKGAALGYIQAQMAALYNVNNRFAFSSSFMCWQQVDVGTVGTVALHVPLPRKGRITEVKVWVNGLVDGATHAALPATMPAFSCRGINMTGGVGATVIGNTTDPSASKAAYETYHAITSGALNHTINPDIVYRIEFQGEAGANSQNNAFGLFGALVKVEP